MRVLLSMGKEKTWRVLPARAKGKYVEHSRRGRGNIEFSPVGRRDL